MTLRHLRGPFPSWTWLMAGLCALVTVGCYGSEGDEGSSGPTGPRGEYRIEPPSEELAEPLGFMLNRMIHCNFTYTAPGVQ